MPAVVDTRVVTRAFVPACAGLSADATTVSFGAGAGDADPESEGVGVGESSAEADAPPAARMAAAPSPTKIGFTAGRQYTAPAPPSHRL
ncbi:hypothetical protein GCM10009527_051470 [Actinomadura nitritigenes]